jgi:hypothetical protein
MRARLDLVFRSPVICASTQPLEKLVPAVIEFLGSMRLNLADRSLSARQISYICQR